MARLFASLLVRLYLWLCGLWQWRQKQQQQHRWYIIEGNIGCGKSTLIQRLKQEEQEYEVIDEPVEVWKSITDSAADSVADSVAGSVGSENVLGLFYKDPHRYAYLFQSIVFKTRMMALEAPQVKPVRFSERSIRTDKHIFSASCFELGYMSVVEKKAYDMWYCWLEQKLSSVSSMPTGIIYLKVSPEDCLKRIHIRDRNEESSVSLDYLTQLHAKHEQWLNTPHGRTEDGVPVYIIDNSGPPMATFAQVQQIVHQKK